MLSFLVLLLGCSGCAPTEAPAPERPPVTAAELEPELMPDLAVPTHADLVLGTLDRSTTDPGPYLPGPSQGDWKSYRVWSSRPERDWRPGGVQLSWFSEAGDGGPTLQQLRPEGETMAVFSTWRLGPAGPHFGVVASASTGAELVDVKPPEVLIATTGTTFQSAWSGMPVVVEILGVQEVTVPAGTFQALRVRRTWARGPRSTAEDRWWTREHGEIASVLRVQTEQTAESRLMALAEFGNVPDPVVLRQVWDDGRAAMGL